MYKRRYLLDTVLAGDGASNDDVVPQTVAVVLQFKYVPYAAKNCGVAQLQCKSHYYSKHEEEGISDSTSQVTAAQKATLRMAGKGGEGHQT